MMLNSYVYFISNGHSEIKIGKANRVGQRKSQGQTWSAEPLIELGRIECSSPKQAFLLESLLHQYFHEVRIHPDREWFTSNEELSQFIEEYKGKHFIDLQKFTLKILEVPMEANKLQWCQTLTAFVIEQAYVEEIDYWQKYVEWYGESCRQEMQAMTVYA